MAILAGRNHSARDGGAACAVAEGLSGKAGNGKNVCVVSGENIDLSKFSELVAGAGVPAGRV